MSSVNESNIKIVGHGSGNPSIKNMKTYLTTRYAGMAYKTVKGTSYSWHKGLIRVRRLNGVTADQVQKMHDTYKTILGRNIYSNSKRQYCYTPASDGKYYSDCSSSVCLTIKKVANSAMYAMNTVEIITKDNFFYDVPVQIKAGHITNPEILQTGDLLMFAGSDYYRTPDHVGHVEMVYEINGEVKFLGSTSSTVTATVTKTVETVQAAATTTTVTSTTSENSLGVKSIGILKKGSTGDVVKALQILLIADGYSCGSYGADGDFGSATKVSLLAYQQKQAIVADGECGPITWGKLLGTSTLKEVKRTATGATVEAMQHLLIGYGYSCGGTGADGDFGANTEAAVKKFQQVNKLTVTGTCNVETWKKLLGL